METRKTLEELTFSDDFMFWKVMSNPELCRQVLEIILNRKIRKVNFTCTPQQMIKNAYGGHGVRLDVIAADKHNTHYNIEMQKTSEDDLRKRSRYYGGQLDLDLLHQGMRYEELPETFIIYVCLFDEFGRGRCLYNFRHLCVQDPVLALDDGQSIIFLNAKGDARDEPPELQAFVAYLNDPGAAERTDVKFITALNEEVEAVRKNSEARSEYMKLELEMEKQRRKGYAEGVAAERAATCKRMLEKNMSVEEIADIMELDIEKVQEMIDMAH